MLCADIATGRTTLLGTVPEAAPLLATDGVTLFALDAAGGPLVHTCACACAVAAPAHRARSPKKGETRV